MLAVPRTDPFDSDDCVYEVKWDGTRVIAFLDKGRKFQNRRLRDIAYRYPEIQPRVRGRVVLDGEIVVLRQGKPDFSLLQQREHAGDELKAALLAKEWPATFVVFDILHWEDQSLLRMPLQERRRFLEEVLEPGGNVYLSEEIRGQGVAFFQAAKEKGLEGIMAKRLDSPYEPGKRVPYWMKIKTYNALDCVVCGLTEGMGWRSDLFGALVLGAYSDGKLHFLGKVGTGFDERMMREIADLSRPLVGRCPFAEKPKVEPAVRAWLKPRLVCEVKYLEFTQEGRLRAPVFLRLRPGVEPEDCVLPSSYPGK